jgi:hypothetical protein
MKKLLFALLIPTFAHAQDFGLPKIGLEPLNQPVVIGVAPANQPSYNDLLQAQARRENMDTLAQQEKVITDRLGIYADNPAARGLMGSILESEMNARGNLQRRDVGR